MRIDGFLPVVKLQSACKQITKTLRHLDHRKSALLLVAVYMINTLPGQVSICRLWLCIADDIVVVSGVRMFTTFQG